MNSFLAITKFFLDHGIFENRFGRFENNLIAFSKPIFSTKSLNVFYVYWCLTILILSKNKSDSSLYKKSDIIVLEILSYNNKRIFFLAKVASP